MSNVEDHNMDNEKFDKNADSGDRSEKKSTRTKFRPDYPISFKFDYKDPSSLARFLFEGGKIVPARVSKLSFKQQKALNKAIKRARHLALLPNGSIAYDDFKRPAPISPKPFEY